MHKDVKNLLLVFLDEFKVYRNIISVTPRYKSQDKDKLRILHSCISSTYSNISNNFSKEELGHFINSIVGDGLIEKYKTLAEGKEWKDLTSLLNKKDLNKIVSLIGKKLKNLPYKYKLYFNTEVSNAIFDGISIEIEEGFYIKGLDPTSLPKDRERLLEQYYGGQVSEVKKGNTLVVETTIEGFIDEFSMTPNLEKVVNKVKMLMALTVIFTIFDYKRYKYISSSVPKSLLILNSEFKFLRVVELEYDVSMSFYKLELGSNVFKNNYMGLIGAVTDKEIFIDKFAKVRDFFRYIQESHSSKTEQNYIKRLENIITWYLIGLSASNKSVGFVSLIFALESLFRVSDTDKGEKISAGVGGRVAYFISEDFTEREKTIEKLKKIYDMRNKIVHEGEQLAEEIFGTLFNDLLEILQQSLYKEILSIK